ncbi:WD domain, G-beta repeat protein, partial [Opisthorchis viverrini]
MTTAKKHSSSEIEPTCIGSGKFIHTFDLKSEALTVRLAPEKDYCAVGQCDGCLLLLPTPNMRKKCVRLELQADEGLPCTDLAFIPRRSELRRLISVCSAFVEDASGFIRIWQFTETGKGSLWKTWRETEVKPDGEGDDDGVTKYNQILCLGVSPDSKRFVTGGSDTIVRVYDILRRSAGRLLIPSIRTDNTVAQNSHTNRVTSLVYHPRGAKDAALAHIFFSASWDGTVQGWDDRTCGSLWQYAGTSVAGSDGLCVDSTRNLLISGSFKHDKVLSQVWQARMFGASENRNTMVNMDKPLSTILQDANSPPVQ